MADIVPYDLEYLRTTNILPPGTRLYTKEQVAVLIAAEREACAKVCDELAHEWRGANSQIIECADKIRTRSNA